MKKLFTTTLILAGLITSTHAQEVATLAKANTPAEPVLTTTTSTDSPTATEEAPQLAPQKLQHVKRVHQDADKVYWQVNLPVYISLATEPGGDGVKLQGVKAEAMREFANPMYFDGHGVHYIRHLDYEHNLPEQEVAYAVHVDGLAPTTLSAFNNSAHYQKSGTLYYSSGLSVALSGDDQMSGLDHIYASVDGAPYTANNAAIAVSKEGQHVLRYYGVDKVGNEEEVHELAFTIDATAPSTAVALENDYLETIVSPRTLMRLQAEDALSGNAKTTWQLDEDGIMIYKGAIKPAYLSDGQHSLTYSSTDHVGNAESMQTYSFYMDKTAPVVSPALKGSMHQANGYTFVSSDTYIELPSTDNKAGVQTVSYSLNWGAEQTYSEPFKLEGKDGGFHLRYRAIDNVNNNTGLSNGEDFGDFGKIMLDNTAPSLKHWFKGALFTTRDTLFINAETKVYLNVKDAGAGIKEVKYQIDADDYTYNEAFSIDKEGYHNITYTGTDNVDNTDSRDFYLVVDKTGPAIFHHFSMDAIGEASLDDVDGPVPVYGAHNQLYLAATDDMVGTEKILYSLDGGAERLYSTPLKALSKGFHKITIRAIDKLGNEQQSGDVYFMIK